MFRTQKALLGLILVSLTLPLPSLVLLRKHAPKGAWADWALNRTLHGVTLPEQSVPLSHATWFSGRFQSSVTAWVNQNFAFREAFIRGYNQMLWTLFGKSYMASESIIQGKDGWLFERGYLQDYNYMGRVLSDAEVEEMANQLLQVRNRLASFGVSFLVLVTPSKATYLPGRIPDRYKSNLANQPRRNYDRVVEELRKRNIPVVDGPAITRENASLLPGNAFPKLGVHWCRPAAYFTAEAFLRASEGDSGLSLARLRQSEVIVNDTASPPDDDLGLLLNLIRLPPGHYLHSTVTLAPGSPLRKGRLTIVGGSFVHQLTDIWEETAAWSSIAHYYYYKVSLFRFPSRRELPIDEARIDWQHDFYGADVVALEINESAMAWNHPAAFVSGLLGSTPPAPISFSFPDGSWHQEEVLGQTKWRWSKGDAKLSVMNATGEPRSLSVSLGLLSNGVPREVALRAPDGSTLWKGSVTQDKTIQLPRMTVVVPPGKSSFELSSDKPGTQPSPSDPRLLAFALYDFAWTVDPAPKIEP